jgi:nitroreductase
MILHLAVASLGLASQWVSIHIQEPFKRILDVPALLTLHTIIPVGYPKQPLTVSYRRKLREIVHEERYEHAKMTDDRCRHTSAPDR